MIRGDWPLRFPQRRAHAATFLGHVKLAMLPSVIKTRPQHGRCVAMIVNNAREPSTSSLPPKRGIPTFCYLYQKPRQCGLIDNFTDDGDDRSGILAEIIYPTPRMTLLSEVPISDRGAATLNIDLSGNQSLEMTLRELPLRGRRGSTAL